MTSYRADARINLRNVRDVTANDVSRVIDTLNQNQLFDDCDIIPGMSAEGGIDFHCKNHPSQYKSIRFTMAMGMSTGHWHQDPDRMRGNMSVVAEWSAQRHVGPPIARATEISLRCVADEASGGWRLADLLAIGTAFVETGAFEESLRRNMASLK